MRRKSQNPPRLTVSRILAWADAHHKKTGKWPKSHSGPLLDGPLGENWRKVDNALRLGLRGLPGKSSLARLLADRRGVKNILSLPQLTEEQILAWADDHHQRTGQWPTGHSGPVASAPLESWHNVDASLRQGLRGLAGMSSLPRLLENHRRVKNRLNVPRLTIKKILAWADSHHQSTGRWPKLSSGPIKYADSETWAAIEAALSNGSRGLPGGSSLAKLLAKYRGVRNNAGLAKLTIELILEWADAHYGVCGKWPNCESGPVMSKPGETWKGINMALHQGLRGLPGGSSLAKLLAEERGVRNRGNLPRLTIDVILRWADAHYLRSGRWPTAKAGEIKDAPGESWRSVEMALYQGHRGLPSGLSIARLLREQRGGSARTKLLHSHP